MAIDALQSRMEQIESALLRVAAEQARTDQVLGVLATRMDQLAEAERRADERLAELAAAQARTEAQVTRLVYEVGGLKGRSLEGEYREQAAAFFQRLLRRIRLVPREELEALADDGEDRGVLSPQEHEGLLYADAVLHGQWRGGRAEAYLVAEVSSVVDLGDVERAVNRAGLLARLTPARVVAAVLALPRWAAANSATFNQPSRIASSS